MSHGLGLMIESLVAVLLLLTIWYCAVLNSKLKLLKADEGSFKATIAELVTATEIAERAVSGLKAAAKECDETLCGQRLRLRRSGLRCSRSANRNRRSCSQPAVAAFGRTAAYADRERAGRSTAPHPRALAAAAQALADRAP